MQLYRHFFSFAFLYLCLSLIVRVIIWHLFGSPLGVTAAELIAAIGVGVLNDCVVLLYILGLFQLYLVIVPNRWYRSNWHRHLLRALVFAVLYGVLYLQAVEICFFEEFNSRFNLVAVDYLIYPHEVLVNLWESYPIVWIMLANVLVTTLLFRWFWPAVKESLVVQASLGSRANTAFVHLLVIVLCACVISTNTFLRSNNRIANQIAANGISSFFEALRTAELDFHAFYRTLPSEQAFSVVKSHLAESGGTLVDAAGVNINRSFPADPAGIGKMNIVVLAEESLGASFVGTYGNTRGLTPQLDALAKRSVLFKHAFSTGTRTVRGLEAISASFPPIPSESILKRPGYESIRSWGRVMKDLGYHSSFLYGGFGMFDNMNNYFSKTGFEISDRAEIEDVTFANIWGVCDEDLFTHAIKYFDRVHTSGKPFFSIVMSTSNHKPYTFPEGIPGIPAKGGGRDAGVKYADYAIGKFFEEAAKHAWFENTLFVVVADHDARVYGKAQVPVEHYRIPLLMFMPKHLAAREIETRTSQIDIAPTVLGILGLPYTAPFYGANVLDPVVSSSRPILLSHNHDVALMLDETLTVVGLGKEVKAYKIDPNDYSQSPIESNPTQVDLITAYLQTGYELFKAQAYK